MFPKGHEMTAVMFTVILQNLALWAFHYIAAMKSQASMSGMLLITLNYCPQQLLIDWDIKRNNFVTLHNTVVNCPTVEVSNT